MSQKSDTTWVIWAVVAVIAIPMIIFFLIFVVFLLIFFGIFAVGTATVVHAQKEIHRQHNESRAAANERQIAVYDELISDAREKIGDFEQQIKKLEAEREQHNERLAALDKIIDAEPAGEIEFEGQTYPNFNFLKSKQTQQSFEIMRRTEQIKQLHREIEFKRREIEGYEDDQRAHRTGSLWPAPRRAEVAQCMSPALRTC